MRTLVTLVALLIVPTSLAALVGVMTYATFGDIGIAFWPLCAAWALAYLLGKEVVARIEDGAA